MLGENAIGDNVLAEFDAQNCKLIKVVLICMAITIAAFVFLKSGLQLHMWSSVITMILSQVITVFLILLLDKVIKNRSIYIHILMIITILDVFMLQYIYAQINNLLLGFVSLFIPIIVSILTTNKYINIYTSFVCSMPFIYAITLADNPGIIQYKRLIIDIFATYIMAAVLVYFINRAYRLNINRVVTVNRDIVDKQNNLQNILSKNTTLGNKTNDIAQSFLSTFDGSLQAQNSILSAIEQIAAGSKQNSEQNEDMSFKMHNLSNMLEKLIALMKQILDSSKNVFDLNKEGNKSMQNLIEKLEVNVESTADFNETIKELGLRTKEISGIIDVINSISNQTSLLSLNASIEAARAGEAGKGFAVVAEEIRMLADQSGKATDKITDIINRVDDSVKASNTNMDELIKVVNEQKISSANTIEVFENIESEVNNIKYEIEEANNSINEIGRFKNDIITLVDSISSLLEETTASVEEINASIKDQNDSMSSAKGILDELIYMSSELKN